MDKHKPASFGTFPQEVSFVLGIALAFSGQWLLVIAAAVVWKLLPAARDERTSSRRLVASVVVAYSLILAYAIYKSAIEVSAVDLALTSVATITSLLILYRPSVVAAVFLIGHRAYLIWNLIDLSAEQFDSIQQRAMLAGILVNALLIWELIAITREVRCSCVDPQPSGAS